MTKRGTDKSADLLCSFCGKSQGEVKKLIAGPGVYICDECIELCNDIIAEEYEKDEAKHARLSIPEPAVIKNRSTSTSSARNGPKRSCPWRSIITTSASIPGWTWTGSSSRRATSC